MKKLILYILLTQILLYTTLLFAYRHTQKSTTELHKAILLQDSTLLAQIEDKINQNKNNWYNNSKKIKCKYSGKPLSWDIKDNKGQTALHVASVHSDIKAVTMLLEKLKYADFLDCQHETPLHKATDPEIIKLLLAAGAYPLIQNNKGLTPLDVLRRKKHTQSAIELLTKIR